jgi:hypothetical protein
MVVTSLSSIAANGQWLPLDIHEGVTLVSGHAEHHEGVQQLSHLPRSSTTD